MDMRILPLLVLISGPQPEVRTIVLEGAVVCRTLLQAKALEWADDAATEHMIRSGKCYRTTRDTEALKVEDGLSIIAFRTADNPSVPKFTLNANTRVERAER